MKKLAFAFLVLISFLHLRADEALKNGDFSEGINQWSGDGHDAAQVAPDLANHGMIFELRHRDWIKAVQEFRPVGNNFVCTVSYKVSADCQFSNKPEDYQNVSGQIGYNTWKPFNIPTGDWLMMIGNFGDSISGTYYPIKLQTNADGTGAFQVKLQRLSVRDRNTITLAFPPGQGSVIILNVSITNGT